MNNPRVDDDAPDPPKACFTSVKSPKYVEFPVVAIVT